MKSNIFTLAVIVFIGMGESAHCITRSGSMLQNPDADNARATPDHITGAPIPCAPGAPTTENSSAANRAWCVRMMLDEYNKRPGADPKVAAFIQHTIDFFCFPATGPVRDDLEKEAAGLEKTGGDDPIFQLLAASEQDDSPRREDLWARSLAGLEKGSYPKFLQFMASAHLSQDLHGDAAEPAEQNARDKATLDLLRAALDADAFKQEEMSVLAWRLTTPPVMDLLRRRGGDVCRILEDSPKVAPWVGNYFEGLRYVHQAWEARGTGYADAVTAEGWDGFRTGIALARVHLVKSWEQNSKSPMAAAEMIVVAAAENEKTDTMRKWFDRAVAAEMDDPDAYNQMLWGLQPKWLGTHEEMIRFGEECMKTGPYDTLVPYTYVSAVTQVAKDADDGGKMLADPQVYKNIQTILSSYLADRNCPIRPRFLHTAAAFMYYKAGKLDEAKKHMEAINYQAAKAQEFAQFDDIPAMVEKLRAYKP